MHHANDRPEKIRSSNFEKLVHCTYELLFQRLLNPKLKRIGVSQPLTALENKYQLERIHNTKYSLYQMPVDKPDPAHGSAKMGGCCRA